MSFDVRGSHARQAVRCTVPSLCDPELLPTAPLPAFFDDLARAMAKTCFDPVGPVLGTLSTNNIAGDIEVLRRSLGAPQITLGCRISA